jgi:hypothetical protein
MLWLYSLWYYGTRSCNLYVCSCRTMERILDVVVVFLSLFELCYGCIHCGIMVQDHVTCMFVVVELWTEF